MQLYYRGLKKNRFLLYLHTYPHVGIPYWRLRVCRMCSVHMSKHSHDMGGGCSFSLSAVPQASGLHTMKFDLYVYL